MEMLRKKTSIASVIFTACMVAMATGRHVPNPIADTAYSCLTDDQCYEDSISGYLRIHGTTYCCYPGNSVFYEFTTQGGSSSSNSEEETEENPFNIDDYIDHNNLPNNDDSTPKPNHNTGIGSDEIIPDRRFNPQTDDVINVTGEQEKSTEAKYSLRNKRDLPTLEEIEIAFEDFKELAENAHDNFKTLTKNLGEQISNEFSEGLGKVKLHPQQGDISVNQEATEPEINEKVTMTPQKQQKALNAPVSHEITVGSEDDGADNGNARNEHSLRHAENSQRKNEAKLNGGNGVIRMTEGPPFELPHHSITEVPKESDSGSNVLKVDQGISTQEPRQDTKKQWGRVRCQCVKSQASPEASSGILESSTWHNMLKALCKLMRRLYYN